MRKYFLLILLFVLPLIVACNSEAVRIYSDSEVSLFTKDIKKLGDGKTRAYDLRDFEECIEERIPKFYCSRILEIEDLKESLDAVVDSIELVLGPKKNTLILLIDSNGENSNYVADKLAEKGFTKIRYFKSGYNKYKELQADFIPEKGDCDC